MFADIPIKPGLEGIVAAQTRLSSVDGQAGELIIGGYAVEELAANATFEEVVYLLWHDRLPNTSELAALHASLVALRPLPNATLTLLQAAAQRQIPVMDALRMATNTLSLAVAGNTADNEQIAQLLVATAPTIIAAYWRLQQGLEPIEPQPELSHAANYLYMLTGAEPSAEQTRALETYLNTVVDHGLNASTFAARVIISTQSDLVSAIGGAIGALKGPLHGGAPGPALDMVFEIGEEAQIETYLRRKLAQGERLMGFGHRIYKVRDPRAEVLSAAAEQLYQSGGDLVLYRLARQVEQRAVALLAEYKPGRNLQTNVEFYTALLLHGLELPTELFSPTFAMSRVGGWTAHCLEQLANNRIFRPQSAYTGEHNRRWLPIAER